MSIVLTILGIIVGLIALLLIAALFFPKNYSIHREIVISRPRADVFDYVRHLKNQDHWSKWVMTDPAMKKSFRGTDGQPGFVYAWSGNDKAGEGEQEIVGVAGNERIDCEIRFVRPFKQTASIPMVLADAGQGGTMVRYGMNGRSAYPMNLMTAVVKGALSKDLDISLNNLKTLLEKQ